MVLDAGKTTLAASFSGNPQTTVSAAAPKPVPTPAPEAVTATTTAAETSKVTFDVQYQSAEIEQNVEIANIRWPKYKCKENVEARWNEGQTYYKCVVLHINDLDKWGQVTYVVRYEDDDEIEYNVHPAFMKRSFKSAVMKVRSCGNCVTCLAPDCGVCRYCLDMRKFGGKGTLRQRCKLRRCNNKIVPNDWTNNSPRKKKSSRRKPSPSATYRPVVSFPDVHDWVKVNYEEDGGWTFGVVVESKPDENVVDILFEDEDQRLETVLDSRGLFDKDFKMATFEEFSGNNKKFGVHTIEATKHIMMVRCFACAKHRKIAKRDGRKIERGWVCGMSGLKDMVTGKLFNCKEGESADLEEIFGKEVMGKVKNDGDSRDGSNSPRRQTFQGIAMESAGVIDGIEMFDSNDDRNRVGDDGMRLGSRSFDDMYGEDSTFSTTRHGGLGGQELMRLAEAVPTEAHQDSKTKKRDLKRLENSRELFIRAARSAGGGEGVNDKKALQHELFEGMDIEITAFEEGDQEDAKKRRMDEEEQEGRRVAMKRSKGESPDAEEQSKMNKRIQFLESMLQTKERENASLAKKLARAEKRIAELEAGGKGARDSGGKTGAEQQAGPATATTTLPFSVTRSIRKAIASDTTKDGGYMFMKFVHNALESAPYLMDVLRDSLDKFDPDDSEDLKDLLRFIIGDSGEVADRPSQRWPENTAPVDVSKENTGEACTRVETTDTNADSKADTNANSNVDTKAHSNSSMESSSPKGNAEEVDSVGEAISKEEKDAWKELQKKLERRSEVGDGGVTANTVLVADQRESSEDDLDEDELEIM